MQATRTRLDGQRWHWQHGPIDLVLQAEGDAAALATSYDAAWSRFEGLLAELVSELPLLRAPVTEGPCPLQGAVARRMWAACRPHREPFITPMAAVAGAVAEALIACYQRPGVRRAWINNGGDIALHLTPGESVSVGLYADLARLESRQLIDGLELDGHFKVSAAWPVRGVATSGWRGRSHSLGIADSVTVLAATASEADAAATAVANAVYVDDPRIERRPACTLRDDSDLGERLVTVQVPPLPAARVQEALDRGVAQARQNRAAGLLWCALLVCQGQVRAVGPWDEKGSEAAQAPSLRGLNEIGSVFA